MGPSARLETSPGIELPAKDTVLDRRKSPILFWAVWALMVDVYFVAFTCWLGLGKGCR